MPFVGNVANVILPNPKQLPNVGGLFRYPLGTTIPATLATLPSTGQKFLGFVSEAGIDETEDRPTTKVYAWGGDIVAEPQDSYDLRITFTLFEYLNPDVAKTAYGDVNVTVTAATPTTGTRMSILQTSNVFDNFVWCWDAFAPGGKRVQKWFSIGAVKNKAVKKTSHKEVLSHNLTVAFLPDANNAYAKELTDDGVFAP